MAGNTMNENLSDNKRCKRQSLKIFFSLCLVAFIILSTMVLMPSKAQNDIAVVSSEVHDVSISTVGDTAGSSNSWKISISAAGTVWFGLLASGFFFGPLTTTIGVREDYIVGSLLVIGAVISAIYLYSAI